MKKALVLVSMALVMMSCEKEPLVNESELRQMPLQQRDSLDWTLDFSTTYNNVSVTNLHPYRVQTLLGFNDQPIGRTFRYQTPQYSFTVMYFWATFQGEDIRITGNLNGHTFIMSNCMINVCGGPQGTVMTYTLKDHTGAVRATCVATNS